MALAQLSNPKDTFGQYVNVIKDRILSKTLDKDFVGHINFKVNIKDGHVLSIQIGNEDFVKI